MKYLHLLFLAIFTLLTACGDEVDCCVLPPASTGFFVINEGGFGNGNSSLSFYDEETGITYNNAFATANGRNLGDQSQSMSLHNGLGYIVVQNSGKVEVINSETFKSVATISDGIESPRYFIGIDNTKGYLSDWGLDGLSGTVKVIDLESQIVTKTIPVGKGANRMLLSGSFVYVTNSGGFGRDNTLVIIDTNTDQVTGTIETGDNPNSIVQDGAGNIWVLCAGYLAFNPDFSIDEGSSTQGSLVRIENNRVTQKIDIPGFTYSTADNLHLSNDQLLYFTFDDQVWSMNTLEDSMPEEPFLKTSLYGLNIDQESGNVMGCETPDFSSAGHVITYDREGNEIQRITVGIAPNSVIFK